MSNATLDHVESLNLELELTRTTRVESLATELSNALLVEAVHIRGADRREALNHPVDERHAVAAVVANEVLAHAKYHLARVQLGRVLGQEDQADVEPVEEEHEVGERVGRDVNRRIVADLRAAQLRRQQQRMLTSVSPARRWPAMSMSITNSTKSQRSLRPGLGSLTTKPFG